MCNTRLAKGASLKGKSVKVVSECLCYVDLSYKAALNAENNK